MFNIFNATNNNNQNTDDGTNDGLLRIRIANSLTREVQANIIFVHGLGADRLSTWGCQNAQSSGCQECWPYWLAADFPNFAVWLFGYEAKKFFIESGHSSALLE